MTECNQFTLVFASCEGRKVVADFQGGEISQESGLLLLLEVDRKLGLLERASKLWPDSRAAQRITHSQLDLVRRRVFALG
mgnify:CR=1